MSSHESNQQTENSAEKLATVEHFEVVMKRDSIKDPFDDDTALAEIGKHDIETGTIDITKPLEGNN